MKSRWTPSLAARMLKKPSPRAMKLAMRPETPETKLCHCCGEVFQRRASNGRLCEPGAWKRRRFCSPQCVRQYRLEGPFRESLPGYLACLEPPEPGR